MDNITEDTIIRASEGSMEDFECIYKEYSGFVYNVAFRVVNNIDGAQEVTQEVFLTVYRKLKSFQFKSSFKTWIYRITVNVAINYAKKESKEQGGAVEYDEEYECTKTVDTLGEKIERDHQGKKKMQTSIRKNRLSV